MDSEFDNVPLSLGQKKSPDQNYYVDVDFTATAYKNVKQAIHRS